MSKQNLCVDTVLLAIHAFCWYPSEVSPIRTAFIPARAAPALDRVIRALRAWNIRIDDTLFLGGMDKGEFLKAFDADIYFDDQQRHCESAR